MCTRSRCRHQTLANAHTIHCGGCYTFFRRVLAEFERTGDVFEARRQDRERLLLVGHGTPEENTRLLGQGTLLCYYCGSRDVEFLSEEDSARLKRSTLGE